jgi:rubrerythrin
MKTFQKTVEDFICEHCGASVKGSGYTNHCPKCLWSKHVDINPGDRRSECRGMMKPIQVEQNNKNEWAIVHECILCGYKKKNTVSREDDMEKIIAIAREFAEKTA